MRFTRRELLIPASALALASCAKPDLGTPAAATAAPGGAGADAAHELFVAVARADVATVDALLDRDPGLLDLRDQRGLSAFAIALLERRRVVAARLRGRGYQPDAIESAWVGDWDRLSTLAGDGHAELDQPHPLGGGAMFAGVMGGHGSELWRVYAEGARPNPRSRAPAGFSPLRAAFELDDLGLAEITAATLLSNDADPNAVEPGGSTALHAAAARGSVELVEMLIRKRAVVDSRDASGRRPVELADAGGHEATAELLRDHDAIARDHVALRRAFDVDGRPYEPTPLDDVPRVEQRRFVGMGHHDLDGIRARLAEDPRLVHARATTSEMAVEAASHVGRLDIAQLLLDHGAPLTMPTAVLANDVGAVARLLDARPDRIHERGPHDFPLLWYPVFAGPSQASLDMMALLLDRGAAVKAQHFLGTTALHFAAMAGQLDMAVLLVERGAEPRRVGRKFAAGGQTPLELARAHGQVELARWLEERDGRGRG